MSDVQDNYRRVVDSMNDAASRSSRPLSSIQLIAVTKTVDISRIRDAIEAGVREIGENRLQEALAKRVELAELPIRWHFIGHLQTNKAAKACEVFDCIQSVDRAELARKLDFYAMRQIPVLIEVNLGKEESKSGVQEDQLAALVETISELKMLDLRGLMTVPPFSDNPEQTRPHFRRLRELGERCQLKELSMGMSHDFEVAIEEGATMVRVGTALFGRRPFPLEKNRKE